MLMQEKKKYYVIINNFNTLCLKLTYYIDRIILHLFVLYNRFILEK